MGPKRRRLEEENDILALVKRREVEESTLVQRLTEYVERIDTDMVRTFVRHKRSLRFFTSKHFAEREWHLYQGSLDGANILVKTWHALG